MLFIAVVEPHLQFGNTAWSPCFEKDKERRQKIWRVSYDEPRKFSRVCATSATSRAWLGLKSRARHTEELEETWLMYSAFKCTHEPFLYFYFLLTRMSSTRWAAPFSGWSVIQAQEAHTFRLKKLDSNAAIVFKERNARFCVVLFRASYVVWRCTSTRQCQTPCSTQHHTVPR